MADCDVNTIGIFFFFFLHGGGGGGGVLCIFAGRVNSAFVVASRENHVISSCCFLCRTFILHG